MRRFITVLLAAGLSLFTSSAFAQVARVFVSVNGNDGNVCSNVATPCRTFSGGIAQVDPAGEVIVLDSGSYGGTTITKPVTIDAPQGVVAFTALPFVINLASGSVTLRGLTMKAVTPGSGVAVTFSSGAGLILDRCLFKDWAPAVSVSVAAAVVIKDSVFDACSGSAVDVNVAAGRASLAVDHCTFANTGSGPAIFARSRVTASVRNSFFASNYGAAATYPAAGATSDLSMSQCDVSGGFYGLDADSAGGTSVLRVANSKLVGLTQALVQSGSGVLESYGSNEIRGNTIPVTGTLTTVATQ